MEFYNNRIRYQHVTFSLDLLSLVPRPFFSAPQKKGLGTRLGLTVHPDDRCFTNFLSDCIISNTQKQVASNHGHFSNKRQDAGPYISRVKEADVENIVIHYD